MKLYRRYQLVFILFLINHLNVFGISSNDLFNDFTTPSIVLVEVPTNATYTNGATLEFDITFDEPVNITGSPQLGLTIGSSTVFATYSGGSGSSIISFDYVVQSGDFDQNGIEITSLTLNGGSIQDLSGDDADLTLNNIEDTSGVLVDAVIPVVTSVNVPADATYTVGEDLDFVVNYDDVVFVSASPQLILTIGSSSVAATYTGGSFASSLTFTYTVQSGDLDTDGIEVTSIALNGSTIKDQVGNNADLTLNNVDNTGAVLVDGTGPEVLSVAVPADDTYIIGEELDFIVTFNEAVTLTGSPQLVIAFESGTVAANYVSGSGGSSLTFTYTVLSGDEDSNGITVNSLSLNGGTIEDGLGNSANLTLNNIADASGVLVDGIIPTVILTEVPPDGTYGPGSDLDFTVQFDEIVDVTGSPELSFIIGSTLVKATFTGGSGTDVLSFSYTVQAGDTDSDGISIQSLSLNGGTIQDSGGNDADLTLNNIEDASAVLVDSAFPHITSVSVPSDGIYGMGEVLNFVVNFNESVDVSGLPQLSFVIGSTTVTADFSSGSGSSAITFSYTVQPGELDTDGIVINPLSLNGGSIQDSGGNDADLTLNNVADASGVLVDGIAPITTSVDVPADGTYSSGDLLEFEVNFNEIVNVSGNPQLSLTIGSTGVVASYVDGTGTSKLVFRYTVQPGDEDVDGITVGLLSLNGGTIEDVAGNDADLTLNNVADASGVLVDAIQPVVTSVTVPSAATYTIGEVLTFDVAFDENVNVTGAPQLMFTIGSTVVAATFLEGSGTSTLRFTYTIQAGDMDTDGIAINSLTLNGGTIRDSLGNDADLTLNNVGDASGVLVDGEVPFVTSVDVPIDDTYIEGESLDFVVNFSEAVDVSGSPELLITIGSTTVGASLTGGTGTASLSFSYIVQSGEIDMDGIAVVSLSLNGGTIQDLAGNDADLTLNNTADASNVLVDAAVPQVTITSTSSDPTNDNPIPIQVTFTEDVTGFISSDLDIVGGTISNFSGTGAIYTFDLTPSAEGILTIDIDADVAFDVAGNGNLAATQFSIESDQTAPNGYAVSIDLGGELAINSINQTSITFSITGGEVGATLNYEFEAFDGTLISGTEVVIASNQTYDNAGAGYDLSSLPDGEVTLTITLTDPAGNEGAEVTDTEIKDTEEPTGFSLAWDDLIINAIEASSTSFTINNAEEKAILSYSISSSGGGSIGPFFSTMDVSNAQTITVDVSVLNDGLLTITGQLTDTVNNSATVVSDEDALLDTTDPNFISVVDLGDGNYRAGETITIQADLGETGLTVTADLGVLDNNFSSMSSFVDQGDGTYLFTTSELDLTNEMFEGVIFITVTATDMAGNTSSNSDHSLLLDKTAPGGYSVVLDDLEYTQSNEQALSFTLSDAEAGTTYEYEISSDGGAAVITGSGDVLSITQQVMGIDISGLEDGDLLLSVSLSDLAGNVGAEATYNLSIKNSEPPIITSGQELEVDENETNGFLVGSVEATDELSSTLTDWTITAGNDDGVFAIGSTTGQITVMDNTALDFETTQSFNLTITVSDGLNTSEEEIVVINVNDLNDNIPLVTPSQVLSIPNANVGTSIGFIEATDLDASTTFTDWTIVSGDGQNVFSLDDSTGELTLSNSDDLEGPYSLVVTVSDGVNTSAEETVTVGLGDVIAPAGYTVNILNEAINTLNQTDLQFEILNVEEVGSYSYEVTNGNSVLGTGLIDNPASIVVRDVDVSELDDGVLTLSVKVTDASGNEGEAVTDEVIKNSLQEIPQGFNPNRETWVIPGIEKYPDNKVVIFNRFGTKIWEVEGYNNRDRVWDGMSNASRSFGSGGAPDGTYFYVIEFSGDPIPPKNGFVIIKR
ncbi:gliding motility-associated C-terminal domain-containing protein [Ekhidna sp.]|uniref:T9SS type B sorting domain-containing protein n=1 Tax=Ekhidna sp. TaxID=2608089 RepID=UPI003C7AE382